MPPMPDDIRRSIALDMRNASAIAGGAGSRDKSAADADDRPHVDGYALLGVIGRGGMGAVYEAIQESTGGRVAIKFMIAPPGAGEAARRRFEREVDLIARLQHPLIVRLLDSGVQRGAYYYVMEHVDGRTLHDALPPGQMSPRQLLPTLVRICEAVDFAHQHGVLHRDLKPSNILVDARGAPRLLDFGLAKSMDPGSGAWLDATLSAPGQVLGTLGYMAPEQARGDSANLSVRSDVYSLGAIAYEAITGRLPCRLDGSLAEILGRIEGHDPPRPSSLNAQASADLDAVLLKALAKEPLRRYPSVREFADDLQRVLTDRPVLARATPGWARALRWARRNRALATVGTVALVLLVVGGGYSVVRIASERNRAVANEQLAREKLRFALEAIDKLVFNMDDKLSQLLGTGQARDELLKVALHFYDELPSDAALLGLEELTGPQYGKLGDALLLRGDVENARANYQRSLEAARRGFELSESADSERGVSLARNLSLALQRIASVEASAAARSVALRESVDLLRLVCDRRPDLSNQEAAARALMRWSEERSFAGDPAGAARAADESLALQAFVAAAAGDPQADRTLLELYDRAALVARFAGDEPLLRSLTQAGCGAALQMLDQTPVDLERDVCALATLNASAGLLLEASACDDADRLLSDARARVESRIAGQPTELRYRLVAGDIYAGLGNAARARGDGSGARFWFEACRNTVRTAFELQPHDVRYRRRYAQSLASLAGMAWEEQDLTAAVDAYQSFLSASEPLLATEPDHIASRVYAWHVIGWNSHTREPARALSCYENGLEELKRLEDRRPLNDYERGLREDLLNDLNEIAATSAPAS